MSGTETTVEKANGVIQAAKVGAISALGNTLYLIQSALFDGEIHTEGLEGTGQISFSSLILWQILENFIHLQ